MNRQDAINIVKKNWPDSSFTSLKEALEFLIPELRNTDDEKIKEAIVKGIIHAAEEGCFCADNYSVKECIEWLKKQGEQKDTYTKQQLRDMGFAFTLNGDIVTPEKTNEAIKEYLANEKKKWEKEQKAIEGSFVNVDDVRDEFIQDIYRILDADPTNDRANQIIDVFDTLPTVQIEQKPVDTTELEMKRHNEGYVKGVHDAYDNVNQARSILNQLRKERPKSEKKHKFKVGDEIKTQREESLTITKIDDKGYWSEDLFICDFDDDIKWKLVE